MQKFARTFIGQHMCTYRYRKRVTFAYWICNLSRRLIKKNNTFTMSGYIKNLLYQIGENANIQLPNIPEIDISYFIERYNLKDKKTVFLNPYAISVSLDVSQLFEHLAEKLANNGYKVITLTANQNQKAIKGTQALTCTLIEAFHLINSYGCVVALRSGFLDLMAFTNAKIICINDAEYEDKYFWNIEQYGVNYDCHTIEYNGNEEMAIQQILAVLSTKC